jgi:hypothetical protein
MIVYHGTTRKRARGIFEKGFLPLPPSRRVWFAESRGYAMGRAKTQARRTHDAPAVLACNLDIQEIRRLRGKGVVHRKGVVAVDGPVPVHVLRDYPYADTPTIPEEVAAWLTSLLRLKPPDAPDSDHPGLVRLSRWINSRLASDPEARLPASELIEKARRWLPEHFAGVRLTAGRLSKQRQIGFASYDVDMPPPGRDPREEEALARLESPEPADRVRGLSLLAELHDPDLSDWCAMFLDDEAVDVRVAALRRMLEGRDVVTEVVEPYANSAERRVRASAIAVLSKHAGDDAARWIERGLRDPEACVRMAAIRFLGQLDPHRDRAPFEVARHDPNPDIADRAERLLLSRRR